MTNTNDNNLLTFLKNQSLFNQSPQRRMSSRSRDRKSGGRSPSPVQNQNMTYANSYNQNQNQNYTNPINIQDNFKSYSSPQGNPTHLNNNLNLQGGNTAGTYQTTTTNYNTTGVSGLQGVSNLQSNVPSYQGGANYQSSAPQIQGGNLQGGLNIQGGNLQSGLNIQGGNYQSTLQGGHQYTPTQGTTLVNNSVDVNKVMLDTVGNLVTYSNSFESARVETAQRLEGLSTKVKTEINNLNYKIEMFNSQMLTVVTQEYNHIKERIFQCVEETFRDSENYVREYMRAQELKFAEEILRARESLQREINSIEAMREDINKPYWRNMAGVFITSEFEARIESVIKQCQTIQTKNIEFETAGFRLVDMEKYLIESVRNRL
jgi:hypothetical protein